MGNLKWQDFRHSPMVLSFARSSFVYHHHLSAWRHGTQICHFVWHKLNLSSTRSFAREKKCLKKQCQIKKLRLTQVTCHLKEVLLFACLWKWGEVELLLVEAIEAKWFNSPPNFYLNAPTQFFAANVPNKDLEVSHLRQKPHQDLWGHISGGEDQSWKPPLTNSWAFLPPVRNWGSCQDLVLPLHPLGAEGTATTIGVE